MGDDGDEVQTAIGEIVDHNGIVAQMGVPEASQRTRKGTIMLAVTSNQRILQFGLDELEQFIVQIGKDPQMLGHRLVEETGARNAPRGLRLVENNVDEGS